MTIDFSGRAVVVTGAGNGLGRVYALEFGRRGANVVVNDLGTSGTGEGASSQDADAVVAEITREGGTAVASDDSVATDAGCRAIADRAMRSFGRIDAVVHNAGILRNAMFEDLTDDDWFAVLATHLTGQFFLSRAVWPIMREQQYGRLVFTSSSSGAFGRPFGANYAAAKAGVLGLCNALAIEGQEHGILADAILPSGLTRMSAAPRPSDIETDPEKLWAARLATVPRFAPGWAVPIVTYLASEACTQTHRYYSNTSGRYGQVFVGATLGWRPDADKPPTAEEIAEHVETIDDLREFDVPSSAYEEMQILKDRYA